MWAIASSHDTVDHVPSARAQLRGVEAVGVVVDVDRGEALVAGEPLGDRVLAIGRQLDEPAGVDVGDEAAARLADPAERAHLVHPASLGIRVWQVGLPPSDTPMTANTRVGRRQARSDWCSASSGARVARHGVAVKRYGAPG